MSKYLYLFCELCYNGVKCGLGTQNLVRYTGVFVITELNTVEFLPIQINVILLGPKNTSIVIMGTLLYQGSLYRSSTYI